MLMGRPPRGDGGANIAKLAAAGLKVGKTVGDGELLSALLRAPYASLAAAAHASGAL